MLPDHSLLAWTALAAAIVLSPGPDTILVAGNAARRGVRSGLAAVAGITTGGLWYIALCGFGFLSVLNVVPGLFTVVRVIGAIYLAWLGFGLLRGFVAPRIESAGPLPMGAPFRQGLITNVLNPKLAVFLLAALPQFVGKGPDAPLQGMALVAIIYAFGFVWLSLVAIFAARAGVRVSQSGLMRWIEGVLGLAFVGLAGKLAFSRN